MKIVRYPAFDWLGRTFACPSCGVLVEFEIADLQGIGRIKPKLIAGQWSALGPCPVEGTVQAFQETAASGEAGEAA